MAVCEPHCARSRPFNSLHCSGGNVIAGRVKPVASIASPKFAHLLTAKRRRHSINQVALLAQSILKTLH